MISPAPIEMTKPEIEEQEVDCRFSDLRGVQWRINLGILPCSASIDELRRVTADSRRRYAGFRRRLLVDPHFFKDGSSSPDLVIDNPLSQNPDSMWGQFFRNAELEKMVDQDLSRLYPDDGSYFQTPACQGILRRILLLWCLRHLEYGYRQGMHELLAPLLYVLHVDVQHLCEVRKVHEHHFNDKFDDISFPESDLVCNYKSMKLATEIGDRNGCHGSAAKASSIDELDPEIQSIVLLTDAYGAEGELGILLSERFMEHDAYCMFDALMGGACGAVAMAEYFSPSPSVGSHTGLPPVIEASSALYHLLSVVDSSLHTHLVELGVEPQYFALRWLRVLFGREFLLDDLLIIWDEIFASDNDKSRLSAEDEESSFGVLRSPRGAFISAMAVSMLLHLRSSLLATETATSCLQRLLNFPENVDVKKLIEKAKPFQSLALDTNICCPAPAPSGGFDRSKSANVRGHSLSMGSISPKTPLNMIPESYWEEKWRVLHKEEAQQGSTGKFSSSGKKRLTERIGLSLGRADSAPCPLKLNSGKKNSRSSVRRSLLEDLSRELGAEEDLEKEECGKADTRNDPFFGVIQEQGRLSLDDTSEQNSLKSDCGSVVRGVSPSRHTDSEENLSDFSATSSPLSSRANDHENDLERSSVASNSFIDRNDANVASNSSVDGIDVEPDNDDPCGAMNNDPPLAVSATIVATSEKPEINADATGKLPGGTKERRHLFGKFPWPWKFGKNAGEGTSEKGEDTEASRSSSVGNNQNNFPVPSTVNGCGMSSGYTVDKKGGHAEASKSSSVGDNQNNVPASSTDNGCSTVDKKGHPEASRSSSVGNKQNSVPVSSADNGCSMSLGDTVDTRGGHAEASRSSSSVGSNQNTVDKKGGQVEASRSSSVGSNQNNVPDSSTVDGCQISSGDTVDKNVMGTLKNLGQSMLENIQVIESVLQQDRSQAAGSLENLSKNILAGKGQVTAVAALKELRKISNLLSEM